MHFDLDTLRHRVHAELGADLAPITAADRDVFRARFARDQRPCSYSHSWLYVIQSSRGLMLRYRSSRLLMALGWHREHVVLTVVVGLNAETYAELERFCQLVFAVYPRPIYIKKVAADQRALFDRRSYWVPSTQYPWDDPAHADEDTFPEAILDLALTMDVQTPWEQWQERYLAARREPITAKDLQKSRKGRSSVRNSLAHFERLGQPVVVEPYTATQREACLAFLYGYFRTQPENVAAYLNILDPQLTIDAAITVRVVSMAGQVVGVWAAEVLNATMMGLYAAVFSREVVGLSRAMYHHIFAEFNRAGYRCLTMGGSELAALHRFKLQFTPIETRQLSLWVWQGLPTGT